jgi:hypothetical protein
VAGCEKKGGDGDGEKQGQTVQATFDKSQYYPFDVVTVQLSETTQAERYTGTIGGHEVEAIRFEESKLAVALPDLSAGEYTLSLQIGDKKADGNLRIVALPAVENPDEVIAEVQTTFDEVLAQAQGADDPDAPFFEELAEVFDERFAGLSADERQQFAAQWQTRYQSLYAPEVANRAVTRGWLSDRMDAVTQLNLLYAGNVTNYSIAVGVFAVSAIVAVTTSWAGSGEIAAVICILDLVYMKILKSENAGMQRRILDAIFMPIQDELATLSRAGTYDYTFSNGASQTFSPQITLRSIYAADVTGSAPAPAKEFIGTTDRFISSWDKLVSAVDQLRETFGIGSPMTGRPQSVSEVTAPLTEKITPDEWTLHILSGNVQAERSGEDGYTFTTTAETDEEFTFKITADGVDTKVFTGLMKVEGKVPEISAAVLENGTVGATYSTTLTAVGTTPIAWSIIDGTLSAGLSLDAVTGVISGTPTEEGNFTFTVKAANEAGEDTESFTITVNEPVEPSALVGKWELASHKIVKHIGGNGAYVVNAGEEDDFYISLAEHGVDGYIAMDFFVGWQTAYDKGRESLQSIEIQQTSDNPGALRIKDGGGGLL